MLAQIGNILRAKPNCFEKFERLLQTRRDQEVPLRRETTNENLKGSAGVKMGLKIAGRHRQFVEIGKQARGPDSILRQHVYATIMPLIVPVQLKGRKRSSRLTRSSSSGDPECTTPDRPQSSHFRVETDLDGRSAQDSVFKSLSRTQTDDGLCLDLDRFACLRIAAHARFAMRFHCPAQIRNHEFAGTALALLDREFEEFVEK